MPFTSQMNAPNMIMDGDGFFVSYNDRDTDIYGCDTTALVFGQMQHFYILNGDHRAQYAPLVAQGYDACFAYFKANIGLVNMRSEMPVDAAVISPGI